MESRYPTTVVTESLPGAKYGRNKGVMHAIREEKRHEAHRRAEEYGPSGMYPCGHVHSDTMAQNCGDLVDIQEGSYGDNARYPITDPNPWL